MPQNTELTSDLLLFEYIADIFSPVPRAAPATGIGVGPEIPVARSPLDELIEPSFNIGSILMPTRINQVTTKTADNVPSSAAVNVATNVNKVCSPELVGDQQDQDTYQFNFNPAARPFTPTHQHGKEKFDIFEDPVGNSGTGIGDSDDDDGDGDGDGDDGDEEEDLLLDPEDEYPESDQDDSSEQSENYLSEETIDIMMKTLGKLNIGESLPLDAEDCVEILRRAIVMISVGAPEATSPQMAVMLQYCYYQPDLAEKSVARALADSDPNALRESPWARVRRLALNRVGTAEPPHTPRKPVSSPMKTTGPPLSDDNIGRRILNKMGYKAGISLGRAGVGILEPLKIGIPKLGRGGLGLFEDRANAEQETQLRETPGSSAKTSRKKSRTKEEAGPSGHKPKKKFTRVKPPEQMETTKASKPAPQEDEYDEKTEASKMPEYSKEFRTAPQWDETEEKAELQEELQPTKAFIPNTQWDEPDQTAGPSKIFGTPRSFRLDSQQEEGTNPSEIVEPFGWAEPAKPFQPESLFGSNARSKEPEAKVESLVTTPQKSETTNPSKIPGQAKPFQPTSEHYAPDDTPVGSWSCTGGLEWKEGPIVLPTYPRGQIYDFPGIGFG